MSSRPLLVLAVLVAAAVAASSAAAATVTVTRSAYSATVLDRGAPGAGVGDQLLFTAALVDAAGVVVGRERGFCTTVAPLRDICRESLTVPTGQVDLQGTATSPSRTLAITGGTAGFSRATGQAALAGSTWTLDVYDGPRAPKSDLVLTQTTVDSAFLDRYLPGPGEGDETYTVADVGGARAGSTESSCVTVTDGAGTAPNVPPYWAQCQQTFTFSNGTVSLEGFVDQTAYAAGEPQTVPIVGGTGAYARAEGEAVVTPSAAILRFGRQSSCTAVTVSHLEQGGQFAQVESGDGARGVGDLLTSMAFLVDEATGAAAGTSHAYFLTTEDTLGSTPLWGQASETVRLPGGTIDFGGSFNQTDFEAYVPQAFAISGGTGAYAGAEGIVVATQVLYPATFRIDVDLQCG